MLPRSAVPRSQDRDWLAARPRVSPVSTSLAWPAQSAGGASSKQLGQEFLDAGRVRVHHLKIFIRKNTLKNEIISRCKDDVSHMVKNIDISDTLCKYPIRSKQLGCEVNRAEQGGRLGQARPGWPRYSASQASVPRSQLSNILALKELRRYVL